MSEETEEEPLYIDAKAKAMLGNKTGMMAVGIAIDLFFHLWWPTKTPFSGDPRLMTELLQEKLPARGYTEESFRQNMKGLKTFFTVLPDGRWAPSPKYFSLTNGNPGSQS